MELGGNAPFVVFDDADVDAAVDGAMIAKMRNSGEACTAANRFHVHNSVREEFTEKLVKRMSEFTLGKGWTTSSTLGPLINAKQVATVDGARRRRGVATAPRSPSAARARRAGPLLPGDGAGRRARRRPHPQGGDLRPGRPDHRLRHRGGGVAAANDTEYGLAAYVYTRRWTARCGSPRAGDRHGRHQPRPDLRPGRAVRRRQANPASAARAARGHRGVPRHQVHRADESNRFFANRRIGSRHSACRGLLRPLARNFRESAPMGAPPGVVAGAPRASPRAGMALGLRAFPALDGIRARRGRARPGRARRHPRCLRRIPRCRRLLRAQRIPDHLAAARRTRPYRAESRWRASGSGARGGCCPR